MSPPDYYSLYLNSSNVQQTAGTVPTPINNNGIIISKSANLALITYQVDFDALFQRKQTNYKRIYLRCVLDTALRSLQAAATANSLPAGEDLDRGVMSIVGLPAPNSNVSCLIFPMSMKNGLIGTNIGSKAIATVTGTLANGIMTVTAETGAYGFCPSGLPWIGALESISIPGQAIAVVYGVSGTIAGGNRLLLTSSSTTDAVSKTYTISRENYSSPTASYVVDTTSAYPEEIAPPVGRSNIQIRFTRHNLSIASADQITMPEYGLKLIFECYMD